MDKVNHVTTLLRRRELAAALMLASGIATASSHGWLVVRPMGILADFAGTATSS